jgi:hypothetical protein
MIEIAVKFALFGIVLGYAAVTALGLGLWK